MSLISQHILRLFLTAIIVSLVAFVSIFFIVDLVEQLDRFLDREVAPLYIALYYAYYLPYIIVLTIPISLLLASLYTFGQLTKSGEITAMKASGLSLYRLISPLLLVSAVISLGIFWAGEWIVPQASMKRTQIKAEQVRTKTGEEQYFRYNIHFRGEEGRQFYIKAIDRRTGKCTGFYIVEFREGSVTKIITAETAIWTNGSWLLLKGIERKFQEKGPLSGYISFASTRYRDWVETPEDFLRGQKLPEEMNYNELARLIESVKRGGGDIQGYLVDLHLKLAFPCISLIIVLLGSALASNLRRGGVAIGFVLSVGTCFLYWGLLRFAQAFGHAGILPPFAAAWGANFLFGLIALILLVRAPK